jgi:excisionase family DNA binding protein
MDCQRRSGDPTWVMLQSLNKRQAPCPKLPTFPHVIDLDRYDESPVAACVALGISQPKLTKLIREAKVRSINIGRTRLIEKAADVRRMATAGR